MVMFGAFSNFIFNKPVENIYHLNKACGFWVDGNSYSALYILDNNGKWENFIWESGFKPDLNTGFKPNQYRGTFIRCVRPLSINGLDVLFLDRNKTEISGSSEIFTVTKTLKRVGSIESRHYRRNLTEFFVSLSAGMHGNNFISYSQYYTGLGAAHYSNRLRGWSINKTFKGFSLKETKLPWYSDYPGWTRRVSSMPSLLWGRMGSLVSFYEDFHFRVFDFDSQRPVNLPVRHEAVRDDRFWALDDSIMVTSSMVPYIGFADVKSQSMRRIGGFDRNVTLHNPSADGSRAILFTHMAEGESPAEKEIWNFKASNTEARLAGSVGVKQFFWSDDGDQIMGYLRRSDGLFDLRIWRTNATDRYVDLDLAEDNRSRVIWNADGSRIVTRSEGQNDAKVWDGRAGELLSKVGYPETAIKNFCWSNPLNALVTTDGWSVNVWRES